MPHLRDIGLAELKKRELVTPSHHAIYDHKFNLVLQGIPWAEWLGKPKAFDCLDEFKATFRAWIQSSRLNRIRGLESFRQLHIVIGTTQTFDEAYFKYAGRRLRLFRGEYAYHRRIVKNFAYIDDAPLAVGDYVIVSAPFCSLGDTHPEMPSMLETAERLAVPVILDCAYFGTCHDYALDVSHPAIESVSFSLTKGLGLGDIRSGVRFSNIQDQNPICQQDFYRHTVPCAARIGIHMMQNFTPDFIPAKYAAAQKEICAELGLKPTKCMHLALGVGPEWAEFIIEERMARVGIRHLVKARNKREI